MMIRVEPMIGEFLLPGEALASIWPTGSEIADVEGAIQRAFVLGSERTLHDDVAFGFQQLNDIAVRSLSPGINDPTTAMICIDRLGELLVHLSHRSTFNAAMRGEDGQVRLVVPERSFAELLDLAFDQIRHYGASDPTVMAHLLRVLGRMNRLVARHSQEALYGFAQFVMTTAGKALHIPEEQANVEQAGTWARIRTPESQGAFRGS